MSENAQTVVERAREAEAESAAWSECVKSMGTSAPVAVMDGLRRYFGYGYQAARAAAITPERVEAAARALRDGDDAYSDTYGDEDYRSMARAAFIAAGFQADARPSWKG